VKSTRSDRDAYNRGMRAPSIFTTSLLCALAVGTVTGFLDVTRDAGYGVSGDMWTTSGDGEPEAGDEGLDVVNPADPRQSLAGMLLVASPDLDDPYFAGAMIYMLADDKEGSLGVVLNHGGRELRPGLRLWDGGPVGRDRVFVLHDDVRDESSVVVNGVAVAADPSLVNDVLEGTGPRNARVFIGYAGWGPGQLADELRAGAWIVAEPSPGMVLAH
jgi:putative transcriptional regulator